MLYIPEDCNLHTYSCVNLKYYMLKKEFTSGKEMILCNSDNHFEVHDKTLIRSIVSTIWQLSSS